MEKIWVPQPKQIQFLQRPEYEALYGGAAGGGKSDALLAEALRQIHIPHYRALILRKTVPQLRELIDRSHTIYGRLGGAKYNASSHVWTFASGAKISFGSMHHVQDRTNYQGLRFDLICFDELTHFTWDEYSYMFSRNRPSGPGTRVYMRAATNPGGIGHGWVKDRFVTAAPPMTPIVEQANYMDLSGRLHTKKRSRIFIPASVFDNQKLMEDSPGYAANLALLPEAEKQALLYGSWDSFSGQVFTEWRDDPAHYRDAKHTHVIAPFPIPDHWRIWRGFDFGYAKPFAVGWFAADEHGRIIMIREYYGTNGQPNVGAKLHPRQIAQVIRQIEQEDENLRGRHILSVADPSIFDESRGESVAAMMASSPHFVTFTAADNTRMAGKMQLHYRLSEDERGIPRFQVFQSCTHTRRTIPALVYDASNVEDVDSDCEDHIYDMIRYVLMESPISPRVRCSDLPLLQDDPLELRKENRFCNF
ncbi:MAG: terminase family protein [Clostridia bacterium]|nr:terminase family protein [Clostridia bacterium]